MATPPQNPILEQQSQVPSHQVTFQSTTFSRSTTNNTSGPEEEDIEYEDDVDNESSYYDADLPPGPPTPRMIQEEIEKRKLEIIEMEKTKRFAKFQEEKTYKERKKEYEREKKRLEKSYISSHSETIMAGTLKIRDLLKQWHKYFCALKPGILEMYRDINKEDWVASVLLSGVQVMPRPSKKDGFSFKIQHPHKTSLLAQKGPQGETFTGFYLPGDYCILRAPNEDEGRQWLVQLEKSIKLDLEDQTLRISEATQGDGLSTAGSLVPSTPATPLLAVPGDRSRLASVGSLLADQDDIDSPAIDDGVSEPRHFTFPQSDVESAGRPTAVDEIVETSWAEGEELGVLIAGEESQSSKIEGENKSIIWGLLKQIKIGMDMSKVILPTFCLEPRSMTDKVSDYFYHSDWITRAALNEDPRERMMMLVKWYISGFYKKPKGLKKPYNPLLGEVYRCMFEHPAVDDIPACRTLLVAEQVSHHPPITALYVSNRRAGWVMQGGMLCGSRFYGNTVVSTFDACFTLHLLGLDETYTFTLPDVSTRGILIGTITSEFGGPVSIECPKTGYKCDLNFKLKPMIGGSVNNIEGKICLNDEVKYQLKGKWDSLITLVNAADKSESTFFAVNQATIKGRLVRKVVPLKDQVPYSESPQGHFDSEISWAKCSASIKESNQADATEHKSYLENAQRQKVKERESNGDEFQTCFFTGSGRHWRYKYANLRPWDPATDLYEYECLGVVQTLSKNPEEEYFDPKLFGMSNAPRSSPFRRHVSLPASSSSRPHVSYPRTLSTQPAITVSSSSPSDAGKGGMRHRGGSVGKSSRPALTTLSEDDRKELVVRIEALEGASLDQKAEIEQLHKKVAVLQAKKHKPPKWLLGLVAFLALAMVYMLLFR